MWSIIIINFDKNTNKKTPFVPQNKCVAKFYKLNIIFVENFVGIFENNK
jgi:hypothetical protein